LAKKRNRKWLNVLLTFVLVFSVIPVTFAQENSTPTSTNEFDPELLKSIKERYMKNRSQYEGTKIDPKINVSSNEKIKVIVEFEVAPMAVQKILAKESNQPFNSMEVNQTMTEWVSTFSKDLKTNSLDAVVTQSFDTVFSGVA
jgi:hypothetical protein